MVEVTSAGFEDEGAQRLEIEAKNFMVKQRSDCCLVGKTLVERV